MQPHHRLVARQQGLSDVLSAPKKWGPFQVVTTATVGPARSVGPTAGIVVRLLNEERFSIKTIPKCGEQSETKDADGRCAGARGSHRPGKGGANPYGTQSNPFRQLVSCGTDQLIQHIPGAQRRLEEDYS